MFTKLKNKFWLYMSRKMPDYYVIEKFKEIHPTDEIRYLYQKHVHETFKIRKDRVQVKNGRRFYNLYHEHDGFHFFETLSEQTKINHRNPQNRPIPIPKPLN